MLDVRHLKAEDLQGLDAEAAARIAALLLDRVAAIDAEHGRQISERDAEIKLSRPPSSRSSPSSSPG